MANPFSGYNVENIAFCVLVQCDWLSEVNPSKKQAIP